MIDVPFAESNYENAILQLFQEQLGYTYIYGPDVTRDYHSPLYEDVLLPCLRRVNSALPMDALTEALQKSRQQRLHRCQPVDRGRELRKAA